jgi:hypothetical protein
MLIKNLASLRIDERRTASAGSTFLALLMVVIGRAGERRKAGQRLLER